MQMTNFLAGPAAPPAPAAAPAPAYKAPVSDGSNQGPQIGERQKITKPPVPHIASAPAKQANNDRTSGMAASLGALADKMHPTKRR
jgi:hypothetical protein